MTLIDYSMAPLDCSVVTQTLSGDLYRAIVCAKSHVPPTLALAKPIVFLGGHQNPEGHQKVPKSINFLFDLQQIVTMPSGESPPYPVISSRDCSLTSTLWHLAYHPLVRTSLVL